MWIIYYRCFDYCNRIQFNHSTNLIRPKKIAQRFRSINFFAIMHIARIKYSHLHWVRWNAITVFGTRREQRKNSIHNCWKKSLHFSCQIEPYSTLNNLWMSRMFFANKLCSSYSLDTPGRSSISSSSIMKIHRPCSIVNQRRRVDERIYDSRKFIKNA